MTPLFGQTRTHVAARHALITPDGHVPSEFPGWENVTANVLISPAMGARLSQFLLTLGKGGSNARFHGDGNEHAIYVETGNCTLSVDGEPPTELGPTGFAYLPPGTQFVIGGDGAARLTVFRKPYEPDPGSSPHPAVYGSASEIPSEPFLGNENAQLQTLLPTVPSFDLAMNIFTYQPGATLPFVETHIMEHGLLMLSGQGIYRLEGRYYPVQAGDAIWMAPYCPQWFVAMGDAPASYLYYKDIHRLP